MFSKDRKIEILTSEAERLRRENQLLKEKSDAEITKKAQELSDEYIKETQDNLAEIKELKEKYRKLIDELEDLKADYEKQMDNEFGFKKRGWFRRTIGR